MTRSAAVDNYLYDIPRPFRETMEALRDLIFHYIPDVEEGIKWNIPCYSHNGLLCYINLEKKTGKVVLSFIEGCMMEDTYGVFQSDTKQVKKIYFNGPRDVKAYMVKSYLKQAMVVNKRKTKNFMLMKQK